MNDLFTNLAGRTDDAETLAALEVDYTPPAVALQLLLALQLFENERAIWRPRRCLDPAAGSGCWGRAMRASFEPEELVGVEPRESEERNLATVYDLPITGKFEDLRRHDLARVDLTPFSLIATNPPFSAFTEFWPLLCLERGLVAPGGIVAFYGLTQWGQSADAAAAMRCWSPYLQLRLGGRPAHREDGKTDSREYSLWCWKAPCFAPTSQAGAVSTRWLGKSRRPSWRTEQLDPLPLELRRWSTSAVPGTYPIDAALVERVRGYL